MIRGWLGLSILVAFLILGVGTSMLMDNAHESTCELLTQAADLTLTGEFDRAVALGQEAKRRWEKQWNSTAVVADHSPMDDVDALFSEMEVYARAGEQPHFAACCLELSKRVKAVAEAHRFSWWNVL